MRKSKLLRPASTWPMGMFCFEAAMAVAKTELVSPSVRTRLGLVFLKSFPRMKMILAV